MRLFRQRLTRREVLAKRWAEMRLFYERSVGADIPIVCRECERKAPTDPIQAATFHVICDGPSRWGRCTGCGEKERICSK